MKSLFRDGEYQVSPFSRSNFYLVSDNFSRKRWGMNWICKTEARPLHLHKISPYTFLTGVNDYQVPTFHHLQHKKSRPPIILEKHILY